MKQQAEVFDDVFVVEPEVKPEKQIHENKDTELLLIERLAKGQITSEAFGLAMLKLKKREKSDLDYHH